MFILKVILLVIGFVMLIKGADLFVNGSCAAARNFNVPTLIIGLTIVGLGTSAPELAVSTAAALHGSNEIALSNVIGSNIFNLLCVLGICACIYPLPVDHNALRRDFPFSLFTTGALLLLIAVSAFNDTYLPLMSAASEVAILSRTLGLSLVMLFIGYIGVLIYSAKKCPSEESDLHREPIYKCLLMIGVGLALIIGGGQAVVYSAKEIAYAAGVSETLIGLTIVAVGTSLPELVTSIVAARKGETDLAIGNVIGSNIFNLLFILGVSTLICPISVNLASVCDLLLLLMISALALIFCLTSRRLVRFEGIVMVFIYIAYVIFAVFRH